MKRIITIILLLVIHTLFSFQKLARVHYTGGGDWYNNPDVLTNLASFYNEQMKQKVFDLEEIKVKLTDIALYDSAFLYLTGHGNIQFSNTERKNLKSYLENGGFLYIDDDYGLDKAVRREMKKIFPDSKLVELPPTHPLFSCYFSFPNGLPKIHKHDKKRPQAFGLYNSTGRLLVLYTYESNISDGWASPHIHKDPPEVRQKALQFGMNILYYNATN